jgi:hypothetical protein
MPEEVTVTVEAPESSEAPEQTASLERAVGHLEAETEHLSETVEEVTETAEIAEAIAETATNIAIDAHSEIQTLRSWVESEMSNLKAEVMLMLDQNEDAPESSTEVEEIELPAVQETEPVQATAQKSLFQTILFG